MLVRTTLLHLATTQSNEDDEAGQWDDVLRSYHRWIFDERH